MFKISIPTTFKGEHQEARTVMLAATPSGDFMILLSDDGRLPGGLSRPASKPGEVFATRERPRTTAMRWLGKVTAGVITLSPKTLEPCLDLDSPEIQPGPTPGDYMRTHVFMAVLPRVIPIPPDAQAHWVPLDTAIDLLGVGRPEAITDSEHKWMLADVLRQHPLSHLREFTLTPQQMATGGLQHDPGPVTTMAVRMPKIQGEPPVDPPGCDVLDRLSRLSDTSFDSGKLRGLLEEISQPVKTAEKSAPYQFGQHENSSGMPYFSPAELRIADLVDVRDLPY